MKADKEYRFCHRKGRAIQVMYKGSTRWISTGCEDMDAAIVFAENHKTDNRQKSMLLKEYARDFWTEKDSHQYRARNEARGKTWNPQYFSIRESLTSRFIIPAHGNIPLDKITPTMIEDFIFSIDKSPSYKNLILITYSQMLQRAKMEGCIQDNPAKDVKPIILMKEKKVEIFSEEELAKLFPDDDVELVNLWGGITNALFFLIFRDTGWRPAEIIGLNKSGYYPDKKAVYTTQSVVLNVLQDSIKTSRKGYDYKIGFITDRTVRIMDKAPTDEDGYYFNTKKGWLNTARTSRILYNACVAVGVKPRKQYTFRHTFDSNLYMNVPDEYRRSLMGHKLNDYNYLHLTADEALDRLNKLR